MNYFEKNYQNYKYAVLIVIAFVTLLAAQDSLQYLPDSTTTSFTKIDSTLYHKNDSLGLKLTFPLENKINRNAIPVPKMPDNPWELDYRSSSYYTPRLVQDKMDQIMNRPRSDSFVPVMAMAFFAANLAVKQLQASKLFQLSAEDYLVDDLEWKILEALWKESPLRIDELYLNTNLKDSTTATELQKHLTHLADKNLIKTRDAGSDIILFYPALDLNSVKQLFIEDVRNDSVNDSLKLQMKIVLERFPKEKDTKAKK
ncbi:MAG: BlaI/MecI/CopY family transcriptional regulator [Calditrichaeota bacterium]|nr:BlaI/MecI/CopY family transcriptional regulator [Calditrichota bacterium]